MSKSGLELEMVPVETPCLIPWETMTGDARSRFCGVCQRQVYNLTMMRNEEIEQVLGMKPCVRYHHTTDGKMITLSQNCHLLTTESLGLLNPSTWAALVLTLGPWGILLVLTGCYFTSGPTKTTQGMPLPRTTATSTSTPKLCK